MRKIGLTSLRYLPPFIYRKISNFSNQKIATNTAWLFADKILRAVGELTVGIGIARYLGPEQFGTLSFAIAFVALFTPLYTLGLEKIVVRDIVQHPKQVRETLGSALGLRLLAGMLGAMVVTGLIIMLRPDQPALQVLVGLMAFGMVFQASDVVTFWFQSQIQAKCYVQARSAAYGIASLARIGCILTRASLAAIGLTYVLEHLLRAVGLGVIYRRTERVKEKWQFSFKRAKTLLQNSWPLMLSGVAIMVYMRIDQVMLGQMANDEAVGIYSAAVKLSEAWYFIPVAIASSTFPIILAAKRQSSTQYYRKLGNLFKFVVAVAYIIALTLSLSAHQLTTTLFGASYAGAATVLSIHVWSGIFTSLGVIRELWMTTENLLIFSFLTTTSGAFLNVAMNYALIPNNGAAGAAIATLFAYAFANVMSCLIHPKTRPIARLMLNSLFFL